MIESGFDRVREVVMACLDLPAGEREEYLNALARHDAELAEAARILVDHDTDALVSWLDGPAQASADDDLDSDELPARIGNYAIRGRLGAGGMGVVYIGIDDALDREVAVKVLSSRMTTSEAALRRFREEARLLARVNHPHIATIYSLEQSDDSVLLVMELVRGRTLAERIRSGPCGVGEALSVARQIASALEAAHREGVVHRDLKPSNVLLSERHGAKVLDFGLAALVGLDDGSDRAGSAEAVEARRASQGETLGTPGYMSPEQIRGSGVETRTDTWSFGCVLFECLTATPLFGGSLSDRLRATMHDDPDLSELPASVPRPLRELIEKCVQKSVTARPPISEVRTTLDAIQEQRELDRALGRVEGGADPARERQARLPFMLTRFVGRERELSEVTGQATRSRLLTIVGLGGAGKTRLAVEAARRFVGAGEPVVFVDLSGVVDEDRVPDAMLNALQPESGARGDVVEALTVALSAGQPRLILDNCEGVREPLARLLMSLLARCPGLSAIATSREPLGILGERVYGLEPMTLPGLATTSPSSYLDSDAVALFVDRARDAAPSFAITDANGGAVATLCHRLDGLPLAIECAAALAPVLAPEEILTRVEERLAAIETPALEVGGRHASLTAVLDDTYERLTEDEQRVLRRLSVFRGGFTLAAAERVVAGDDDGRWDVQGVLANLVRRSLVVREEAPGGGGSRFRLLETVRVYAEDQLDEAGERGQTLDRHLGYFADYASSIRIVGPAQAKALATIHAEIDNVHAILGRADGQAQAAIELGSSGDGAAEETARVILAAQVALGMVGYWIRTGRWQEGRRACAAAAQRLHTIGEQNRAEYVSLGRSLGEIAVAQGDLEGARRHLTDAREVAESLREPKFIIGILNTLGTVEKSAGQFEVARDLYDEAIALRRVHVDDWDLSGIIFNRGVACAMHGAFDDAKADFNESLRIKRELGDERGIAHALNALGLVATHQAAFEEALPLLEESLAIKRELGDRPGVVTTLMNLGLNALDRFRSRQTTPGLLGEARRWYEEALALAGELGDRPNQAPIQVGLTWVALHEEDREGALRAIDASLAVANEVGDVHQQAASLVVRGFCDLFADDPEKALAVGREAAGRLRDNGSERSPDCMDLLAWSHRALGDAARTVAYLGAARVQREAARLGTSQWRVARNDDTQAWAERELDRESLEAAEETGRGLTDLTRALEFGECAR